ncbi:MAG TPA: hypothetical protein VL614_05725 [Acetobacteraceae bacterium]|jgi:hypothetical protein|nr:hypothetical protein [Acetobacteraceae bacterium]
MTKHILLGLLASVALTYPALAQNPQPAPPQATQAPLAPPSTSQPPPEKIAPHQGTFNQGTLSDQLSDQKGTLRPPSVDPGINAPLPMQAQGSMPVIPPPGTPGGNQGVVPK